MHEEKLYHIGFTTLIATTITAALTLDGQQALLMGVAAAGGSAIGGYTALETNDMKRIPKKSLQTVVTSLSGTAFAVGLNAIMKNKIVPIRAARTTSAIRVTSAPGMMKTKEILTAFTIIALADAASVAVFDRK